jgi:hypothetical protein
MKKPFILFVLPFIIGACSLLTGEEVGRLKINRLSTEDDLQSEEVSIDLKKGDEIAIWSEMDVKYKGEVMFLFKIQVFNGDDFVELLEIDPMDKNVSVGEVKTQINGKTNWKFSGKNMKYEIKEDGKYTFKGILIASKDSDLKIEKAEVVFKK